MDTSIGSFADNTSSFVGYRVQEQLATIGGNVAVGRTPNVSGTLTISGTKLTTATITADLTTLQSDDSRRDGQLRRQGIETGTYPTATFTLTSPVEVTSVPADGQTVEVTATGNLTLHGVTKEVQIPLTARLTGSVIEVTGVAQIPSAVRQAFQISQDGEPGPVGIVVPYDLLIESHVFDSPPWPAPGPGWG